jgi:hypothetical protein
MDLKGICEYWSLDPPELHFLNFYFDTDPDSDPAIHFNADVDPDPASKNNPDP